MASETLKSGCGAELHLQLKNRDGTPFTTLRSVPITLEVPIVLQPSSMLCIFYAYWSNYCVCEASCGLVHSSVRPWTCIVSDDMCVVASDGIVYLQISAVNARMYKAAVDSGADPDVDADFVASCVLSFNKEVRMMSIQNLFASHLPKSTSMPALSVTVPMIAYSSYLFTVLAYYREQPF